LDVKASSEVRPAARLPVDDLGYVVEHVLGWDELAGANLFLTGGTGFFGIWFLESLLYANDRLNIKTCTDPGRKVSSRRRPHYANPPWVYVPL
jgi:dTDP-glucose 4,6-dehydratase